MSLNRTVLVLNASYEPIQIVSARRAFVLLFKGAAVVEAQSGYTIRTPQIDIPVPSVLRLVRYRRVPRLNRSVSRKGILLRDRNTCQYCHAVLPAKELTLDHVIPRSRGGGNAWENLVACCFPCNNEKGQRTPAEAGMELARRPQSVSIHAKLRLLQTDAAWDRYLFA